MIIIIGGSMTKVARRWTISPGVCTRAPRVDFLSLSLSLSVSLFFPLSSDFSLSRPFQSSGIARAALGGPPVDSVTLKINKVQPRPLPPRRPLRYVV